MSDPLRWSKFYWNDWATDPKLSECSLAAQGLWMRILCEMARHDPPGRLEVDTNGIPLSRVVRKLHTDFRTIRSCVRYLIDNQVCDIKDGYMISRRMVRDWHKIQHGQQAAAKRWGKKSSQEPNGSPNGSDAYAPNGLEVQDSQEANKGGGGALRPLSRACARDHRHKPFKNPFLEIIRREAEEN